MATDKKQAANRRVYGDGTIYRRADGRCELRIPNGLDPFGKQKRKSFYGKDERDVMRQYKAWLKAGGKSTEPKVLTFGQWSTKWLETYKQGKVSDGTYYEYELIVNNVLIPAIGSVKLDQLRPVHFESVITDLLLPPKNKKKVGKKPTEFKPPSDSRLKKVRFLLVSIMDGAVNNGYVQTNYARGVTLPAKQQKSVDVFAANEITTILKFADTHDWGRLVKLALYTGMRRGELVGLAWSNVDLEHDMIQVIQAAAKSNSGEVLKSTKTGKERVVPVTPALKELLQSIPKNSLYVICNPDGSRLSVDMFSLRYKAFFDDLQTEHPEVRYLSPHKCRHTFASYLLKGGVDMKFIQLLLGHSEIGTTANIYTHVDTDGLKNNITKLTY